MSVPAIWRTTGKGKRASWMNVVVVANNKDVRENPFAAFENEEKKSRPKKNYITIMLL